MNSLLQTVFLILIIFGAFSISVLWIDVFQNAGASIGWSRKNTLGSFYLAAIMTILFITLLLLLDNYNVNFANVLYKVGI